jgi:hypothetical protein
MPAAADFPEIASEASPNVQIPRRNFQRSAQMSGAWALRRGP